MATEIDLGTWKVTRESLQKYLEAVGDEQPQCAEWGLVPPLAVAAQALGRLLERMALPPGAIHSMQEVEARNPVPVGSEVQGVASLERPRRRGDVEFLTVSYTLYDSPGRELVSCSSTVLVPLSGKAAE